jgi:hypothetical protein
MEYARFLMLAALTDELEASAVFRIRDILVRIRILGLVSLPTDPDPDPGVKKAPDPGSKSATLVPAEQPMIFLNLKIKHGQLNYSMVFMCCFYM